MAATVGCPDAADPSGGGQRRLFQNGAVRRGGLRQQGKQSGLFSESEKKKQGAHRFYAAASSAETAGRSEAGTGGLSVQPAGNVG